MKINLTENKKKILVLSCMVVLLVLAGTLSIVLNLNAGKLNDGNNSLDGTQSTFFTELQSDRELRKNEQIALLDAIINNDNSTQEAIANAEAEKLAIVNNIKTEMALEAMIKAKGFDNVAVMIGNEKINVFVDKAELLDEENATICSIIMEQTKFTIADIIVNATMTK